MPYTPYYQSSGGWQPGTTTPATAAALNNLETQYTEAVNSIEQDLLTAFVLSGLACTKDGTTASQLDVTAGVALLQQSDNTLRRRAPTATNFSTSGHTSTTMYLDLNPDGTWSWGTAHSGVSNYLPICQVATDGSANISTVTDERNQNTTLLGSMTGQLTIHPELFTGKLHVGTALYGANGVVTIGDKLSLDNGKITSDGNGLLTVTNFASSGYLHVGAFVSGSVSYLTYASAGNHFEIGTPTAGASAQGIDFVTWDGAATHVPFSLGGQVAGALTWIDSNGIFNSVLPGQAGDQAHLVLQQTAANGATANTIYISMNHGGGIDIYDSNGGASIMGGGASGVTFTGAVTAPGFWGKIQTNRNGVNQLNTIFTGTNTPTSPAVGDIWIKA